jgi:hypothetical protein
MAYRVNRLNNPMRDTLHCDITYVSILRTLSLPAFIAMNLRENPGCVSLNQITCMHFHYFGFTIPVRVHLSSGSRALEIVLHLNYP